MKLKSLSIKEERNNSLDSELDFNLYYEDYIDFDI